MERYFQHSGAIRDLAALPDGRVVSASKDRSIQIWHPDGETAPIRLDGHWRTVTAVDTFDDGRRIVSGSEDDTVRIWDLQDRRAGPVTFEGHTDDVLSVLALADGRIVSAGEDGTMRFWNPDEGDPALDILSLGTRIWDLAELPDGRIVAGSADGLVRIIDPTDLDAEPRIFDGHTNQVLTVTVLADGRVASGGNDQTVQVWDPNNLATPALVFVGHERRVQSLASTADGTVISGSLDGTASILSLIHISEPTRPY